MDTPGLLESQAAESYYYVTPVEPHWTERQKEEWLCNFNFHTLQIVSIHEAYPGHFVHYLHSRSAPSLVSKALGSYSFSEGWAHYTEEMMLEAGYGHDDHSLKLSQVCEALATRLPVPVFHRYAHPGNGPGRGCQVFYGEGLYGGVSR